MKMGDMLRGLFGKRRQAALPSSKPNPVQPEAASALTEQDLEQVQGGASEGGLPIERSSYQGPDSFQVIQQWSAYK
jgi:hypothetical protein